MKEGTLELFSLGIAFFVLQIWWISMTIKNGKNETMINGNQDPLAFTKKRLENLLKK